MDDPNVIAGYIKDLGIPGVLVVYFLYKDWKWTAQINQLMGEVKALLELLVTRGANGGQDHAA